MEGLNEYQKRAAEYQGKHLLVLAGAGTGKTKTIIARAEYLIKSGVNPKRIAILSFTRKSAREIAERIKASVTGEFDTKSLSGRTFHSWCNEIMHIYPDIFPQSEYTLLDEDDRISAMGLALGKHFKDSQGEKVKSQTLVAIYSYAVNTQSSLSESIRQIRYYNSHLEGKDLEKIIEKDKAIIAPVIKKFIDYKVSRHYLDYDDMLNIVADAIQNNESIRKMVTKRWEHILVDELQDTNPLQYKLLKSFIDESHLFCVGDDAQSIYAFRGADFQTIHSFTDIVPHSEVYKLLLNYRSTQEILDLANWLLEQSPLDYDKHLKSFRGKGTKPLLIHIDSDWEEANAITDDIIQSVAEGNSKYGDTMVLSRSNWALSKVEGSCLQKKIPYRKLGGLSLMQTAHVRDVAAAMRVVANNYDEIAWIRYLKLWDGIGDVTASKIIADIIYLASFSQIIRYLENSNNKNLISSIPETLTVIHEHINHPTRAMREAVQSMDEILTKKYKEEWNYRINDFEVLEEVAKSSGSISEFIADYILDPRAETTFKLADTPIDDLVTLSTIHSAKGLEAKTVHIINLDPHSYPSLRSIKQGEEAVEEERRCLYVALTRAKDSLKLYRNIKSLHTQYPKDEEVILVAGNYRERTNENTEFLVIHISDDKVTTRNKKTGKIKEYSKRDFLQKFSKIESQINALYFLNKLPPDLVDIVVSDKNILEQERTSGISDSARLPDFNFD